MPCIGDSSHSQFSILRVSTSDGPQLSVLGMIGSTDIPQMIVGFAAGVLYVTDHRHFRGKYNTNVSGSKTWRYVTVADFDHGDIMFRLIVS